MKHKKTIGRAGAGKTTRMIADVTALADEGKKIEVVVFSKRLQTELSSKIYHDNVNVTTFHAMAYKAFGKTLTYPTSYMSVKNVISNLSTREATVLSKLFNMFTQSKSDYKEFADRIFASDFVLEYAKTIKSMKSPEILAGMIQEVMESYTDNTTHDVYLKRYQLSKPSNRNDIIVIDEYQDYSEVMIDIIMSFNKLTLMYGDSEQKIFGFRFATGEFPMEFDLTTLPETNRCPSNITQLANSYLGILGATEMTSRIADGNIFAYDNFPVIKENSTFISNYNFVAIEAILYYAHKVNFEIHIDIKMDKLEEMWNFVHKRGDVPKWMSRFASVEHLSKFYQETENINGLTLIKCAKIISNWSKFKAMINHFDEDQPTLILTNVFISKGLEWDNVILAPDFTDIEDASYAQMTYDSMRFLYTAITRSKKNLWIPSYLDKESITPSCEFIEDSGDMVQQKENELTMKKSKNKCGREDRYSDTEEIEPNSGEVKGSYPSGLQLNVKSVTTFSKGDSGLYFAQQMDKSNDDLNVMDDNGGGANANANRYMESKMTGIPIRDLELRDKCDTYLPDERTIAEIGMRMSSEFTL